VGIGHSPTLRRWDGKTETSVGAWTILAIRRAIEDAGVDPAEVDGIVLAPDASTGSFWPEGQPVPEEFLKKYQQSSNPLDGLSMISAEWLLKNIPELVNVDFVMYAPADMNHILPAAIEAVGQGRSKVCLAVKAWVNFEGRYHHGGENAQPVVQSAVKWVASMAGPPVFRYAQQFQRYLWKYGKTHDMLAPFVVNSKKNGLLFPEGYWAQHKPEEITVEDYVNARWIAKPANLFDNDIPIHTSGAYVITTAERAKDLKQKPAYVLGHSGVGNPKAMPFLSARSGGVVETLEEAEEGAALAGRRIYESAGVKASDLAFENTYDGFSLFHVFHIEGLGYAGIKKGEALDLFQTDISIHGPHPVSPSGGNIGSGRTRFWLHTDSIQQIQGRAGARAITGRSVEIGLSGGPLTSSGNFIVWSKTPE